MVVLPDSQIYAEAYPELIRAQGEFVAENLERLNIRCVIHEGDVTNDNSEAQWERARAGYAPILGRVPFVVALGNHDYGEGGTANDRFTRLHDFISFDELSDGLVTSFEPDRVDNALYRFDTPSGPWQVLNLEFGPRQSVVDWAGRVLGEHRDPTLLVTHAFLYSDGTRYDRSRDDQKWSADLYGISRGEPILDAEGVFQELLLPNPHVCFALSGHVLNEGTGRREDVRPDGTLIHQILANYQTDREGGASALRVMEFTPDQDVFVRTYLPSAQVERREPENSFRVRLNP